MFYKGHKTWVNTEKQYDAAIEEAQSLENHPGITYQQQQLARLVGECMKDNKAMAQVLRDLSQFQSK